MNKHVLVAALGLSALASDLSAQCPDGSARPCPTVRAAARALDPNVIAVIPFRVTGADTALAEGLAELIAAEFTGEGVPRAADQGAVWSAWRDFGGRPGTPIKQADALKVAARLGAGQVLIGSVVELGGRITFNALTLNVPSGAVRSRAEPVSSAADSLSAMVGRLITNLLAGSGARVIAGIGKAGTSSAEAMRAFMAGTAAHRRGRSADAQTEFARAIELDSTFALAALGGTVGWGVGPVPMQRLAWSLRDRLSAAGKALLSAYLGPNYPNTSTISERLVHLEKTAAAFPDNADLLYELGDTYFHSGFALGFADGLERSNAAFLRSIAADSMLAFPLIHLLHYSVARGDTANVRRYGERLLGYTAVPWVEASVRWHMAVATHEPVAVDRALQWLERPNGGANNALNVIRYDGLWDSTGMAHADRLLAAATRIAASDSERLLVRRWRANVDRNRGRPRTAHAAVSGPDFGPDVGGVYEWLYGDGDSVSASSAVQSLQPIADAPLATTAAARARQFDALCVVEQWRLSRGETATVDRTIQRLASAAGPVDEPGELDRAHLCARALTALRAVLGKLPGADVAVTTLDSVIVSLGDNTRLRMLLARLHESRGDIPGALRAIRRRGQFLSFPVSDLLAASLRKEGRLAALAGDRAGAIKAYRWYLTLVTDPEPALVPTRDRVKAELARLERER